MEETIETGVIYMITNNLNNKKYIGKAFSFEKHGVKKPSYYSAKGRFRRHKSNVAKNNMEIPILYKAMKEDGVDNFKVETLEVCKIDDLKERETYYINHYRTFKSTIGYNYHVGDNKPEDEEYKKKYENKKAESNKTRSDDGQMRQSTETATLPKYIYKRKNGLIVQVKIDNEVKVKSFLSKNQTDEEKLKLAQEWLRDVTREINID